MPYHDQHDVRTAATERQAYWQTHGAFSTGRFRGAMDTRRTHNRTQNPHSDRMPVSWIERALPGPAAANPLQKTKDFAHSYSGTASPWKPDRFEEENRLSGRVRVYEDILDERQPVIVLEEDPTQTPHPMTTMMVEYIAAEIGLYITPHRLPRTVMGECATRALARVRPGSWPPFFLIQHTLGSETNRNHPRDEFAFVGFTTYVPRGRPGMHWNPGEPGHMAGTLGVRRQQLQLGVPSWTHLDDRSAVEDFLGACLDDAADAEPEQGSDNEQRTVNQ